MIQRSKVRHWRPGNSWLGLNRLLTFHLLKFRLGRPARGLQYEPAPGSMLYIAASALPYHTSGYTTRTHEVIRALREAGAEVHAMTRPGYPWDRRDRQLNANGSITVVDGVSYHHSESPRNNRPVLQYAFQAARAIAEVATRRRVAVIHAASNHVNALPALLAARQLGIPFQYEMRGLWELTRVSRTPHYEGSQAYKQGLQLEGLVASQADRLFVISEQLGNFARARWGVAAERMALLPNCVDPTRFSAHASADVEPRTIGYAGTLIGYEGLDTLIDAVHLLVRCGTTVNVTLIGDGEARSQLEEQVRRLGLAGYIRFVGKVPPDAVQAMLQRCAVICIPRKPYQVCTIVPPIKLVEALAMGKPVIAPDLPVFRDEMGEAPAGWFFRSGDANDLAEVIKSALADSIALRSMGARAREYAALRRNWRDFIVKALPAQSRVGGQHGR